MPVNLLGISIGEQDALSRFAVNLFQSRNPSSNEHIMVQNQIHIVTVNIHTYITFERSKTTIIKWRWWWLAAENTSMNDVGGYQSASR